MAAWKLNEEAHCTSFHNYFRKAVRTYGYTEKAHWRYFTFMHMVGAKKHNSDLTHRELLEQFENGKFYSNATVKAMETKYLKRIAEITQECLDDDDNFRCAAVTVAFRASLPRQSSRSSRKGKIKNH